LDGAFPSMNPIALFAVGGATGIDIPLWLTAPFALLLLLIAVMPLTPPRVKHLWDRYYMHTALGLGLAVVAYYLWHADGATVLVTSRDYFSFISLIGSLFVVAGGIHLKVKGEATPSATWCFSRSGRWRPISSAPPGVDGAHPALHPDEQGAHQRLPYRFLHLHRLQLRRCAHAHRRSAPLPRLSARRAVLLADRPRDPAVAVHDGGNPGGLLCLRPPGLPPRAAGRARQNRGARHLALRGRRQRACCCW
jgi:hypothetical protein